MKGGRRVANPSDGPPACLRHLWAHRHPTERRTKRTTIAPTSATQTSAGYTSKALAGNSCKRSRDDCSLRGRIGLEQARQRTVLEMLLEAARGESTGCTLLLEAWVYANKGLPNLLNVDANAEPTFDVPDLFVCCGPQWSRAREPRRSDAQQSEVTTKKSLPKQLTSPWS